MPALAQSIRRRRQRKARRKAQARKTALKTGAFIVLPMTLLALPMLALLALSIWLYADASALMPDPRQMAQAVISRAARFTDRHGAPLQQTAVDATAESRWLALDELPDYLVAAQRLTNGNGHAAFDPLATLAQLSGYILGAPPQADGSLAAQLVRQSLLPQTASSDRDARLLGIVFSAEIKRRLSVDALLEWRLNSQVYAGAAGIEPASQRLLGKSATALSPAEAALMTALGADPALDAREAWSAILAQAADLLQQLAQAGLVGEREAQPSALESLALRESLPAASGGESDLVAYARAQARQILDRQGLDGRRLLDSGGLTITTTLDLNLPSLPESASAALLDARTGEILRLNGDALAAASQPAGLLSAFVYMDAFASRAATPATMLYDIETAYAESDADLPFAAANADGSQRGALSLRAAMAAGLTPPLAQIANQRGMRNAVDLAAALGIASLDGQRADLRLLQSGGAVSALDAAYAYNTLASMGVMRGLPAASDSLRGRDPVALLRIVDAAGQILWQYQAGSSQSIIVEPSLAYLVNDILADDETRENTLGRADAPPARQRAILTASSADDRDYWLVIYSPDLTLAAQDARALPADEWGAWLEAAHQKRDLPPRQWTAPPDIEEYLVCEISGMLPATTNHCPTRREIVPAASLLLPDDRWIQLEINRETGLLAGVNTPDSLRQTRAYFTPPEDIRQWWQDNDMPLPPSRYSPASDISGGQPVQLLQPADFAYAGARVDIAARINRAGAQSWKLEYGAGGNPEAWIVIDQARTVPDDAEIAASWQTALFSGLYSLRLSVTYPDGSAETDTRLLTFDNTPPSVKLWTSAAASDIQTGAAIPLLADASDNLGIERVEFWHGDELLGTDRNFPYGYEATLGDAGQVTLRALAFDQVGNRAESRLRLSLDGG